MTGWYSSSWKARSLEYGEGGGFPPPFSYATKQSSGDKTHRPPDTAARLRPTKQPVCFTTERAVCDNSSFQSDNLIIEHYELFLYHHVFVVVSEKPVLESASLSNLIEKVCQGIPLEQPAAECVLNATGAAVGDDVVHVPTCFVQCFSCGPVFVLAGQFLFPPGAVIDSVESACGVELPQLSLIVRIIRFQNAVPDIVAAGAAHGKYPLSADVIKLAPHQMQDAGAYGLYQAAVPLADWIVAEQIIVFMVSADEQRGKGPGLQPVQPLLLRIAAIPDTAEVSVIPNSGQR